MIRRRADIETSAGVQLQVGKGGAREAAIAYVPIRASFTASKSMADAAVHGRSGGEVSTKRVRDEVADCAGYQDCLGERSGS